MKRFLVLGATLGLAAVVTPAASPARALCVGARPGCYSTIQAAVDAASDGDTIQIAAGTFAGGVTIDKSISLVGSGAKATTIRGGGPVLTIGEFLGTSQLAVTISGLSITGGVTSSSPLSTEWTGEEDVIALGGGIAIEPTADYSTGATVTISNSVISGNRAAASETMPSGPSCPGGVHCPFAWSFGGGIDSWGDVTLRNTTVSDNTAAGLASDADGGGIHVWWPGTLHVTGSSVVGNRAIAGIPNGRFAEGGGVFLDPGVELEVKGSVVSNNTAGLTSSFPFDVGAGDTLDMNANGGGIHVGDDSQVTIVGSTLNGNTASVDDANGEPYAFDAALHPGTGPLVLRDTTMANNHVVANVASTADVGPSGSALDILGPTTLSNVQITENTTAVTSHAGDAGANGAVYAGSTDAPAVIKDSVIARNTLSASSSGGAAIALGAGLVNDGLLELRGVLISQNSGTATGPSGAARGGGIWNGSLFNSPPIELTLVDTNVTRNTLTGSPGIVVQGGGVFTDFHVTLTNSRIAGNTPDQCIGC